MLLAAERLRKLRNRFTNKLFCAARTLKRVAQKYLFFAKRGAPVVVHALTRYAKVE